MKNSFYHKISVIDALTQNHWVLVAIAFIAVSVIIGMCQYCIRGHKLAKRFGDGPYFLLGVTSAIVMSAMLVIESLAGIIQLLDNLIVGNEPAMLNPVAAFFVAIVFGIVFGVIIVIIGDLMSGLRKRSLIKSLRLAAEISRKAHHTQQIRRGQPTGNPRPGATRPTRYNAERDAANHHHHANQVSTGKGMRRR